MKLVSWNVNGLRAVAKKDFFKDLEKMNPDILCLQETKAQDNQVAEVFFGIENYELFSNSAEKKGYSGTAVLTKIKPLHVSSDMGIEEHDKGLLPGQRVYSQFRERSESFGLPAAVGSGLLQLFEKAGKEKAGDYLRGF